MTKPLVKVYEGRPCRRCGETLKFTCNSSCIACERARRRLENLSPEQVERHRGYSRAHYDRMTERRYNELLLQHRRQKALVRQARRKREREQATPAGGDSHSEIQT